MEKKNSRKIEMESHFQLWQQSGLSKKKYSGQAGIGYHTFLYWIDRLTAEQYSGGSFQELHLPVAAEPSGPIEIEYPSGVRIRLNSSFPAGFIKSLL